MAAMDPDDLSMLYELDRIGALTDAQRAKIVENMTTGIEVNSWSKIAE